MGRFYLLADFDDGNAQSEYHAVALADDVLQVNHTWSVDGNYTVNITLAGFLNTVTVLHTIKVQNRIDNLTLAYPNPIEILPDYPGETDFSVNFLGGLVPTDAFYDYTLGDGSTVNKYLAISTSSPSMDVHNYSAVGTYNVTLNVSNCVSYMWFRKEVVVDEPIRDLSVWSEPRIHKLTESVRIHVNITWGSRLHVTWVLQDGTNQTQFFNTHQEDKFIDYVYGSKGHYFVKIIASNVHGSHEVTLIPPIIVQHPVRGFKFDCWKQGLISPPHWNTSLPCRLWLQTIYSFPTDANITVDYGDGLSVTWPLADNSDGMTSPTHHVVGRFQHPVGYMSSGQPLVQVTIENLVSVQVMNFSVKLFTGIVGLEKQVFIFDNETGDTGSGMGKNKSYYPLEESILFQVGISNGSEVYYKWAFGNGQTVTVYEIPYYVYEYDTPGTYNVSLNASNVLDNRFLWRQIHVQRSCSPVGLWVQSPAPRNTTFKFQLDPGNMPTDACYFINFLDPNSTDNKYVKSHII